MKRAYNKIMPTLPGSRLPDDDSGNGKDGSLAEKQNTERIPQMPLPEYPSKRASEHERANPHKDPHNASEHEKSGEVAPTPSDTTDDGTDQEPPSVQEPQLQQEPENVETKRPWLKPLIIIVGIFAIAGGIAWHMWASHFVSTDDAFIEAHVVQVSPRISAHVLKVLVEDNQRVKAGSVLVELDGTELQAKLDEERATLNESRAMLRQAEISLELTSVTANAAYAQAAAGSNAAEAQVGSARAQLETNRSHTGESEAQIRSAEASVAQAHSEVTAAQADEQRLAGDAKRAAALYASRTIAREEYEHALTAAKAATAKVAAAQDVLRAAQATVAQMQAAQKASQSTVEQYKSQVSAAQAALKESQARVQSADVAEQQVSSARAKVETARADVQAAEARVRQAELDLSYTSVKAPIDGQVARRTVEAGNYVQTGQALLAIVADDKWIIANFKETQLREMKVGDTAEIEIDSHDGDKLKAQVDSIQPGTGSRFSLLPPENATGNFVKVVQRVPVKLTFTEPLPPNAFVAPGVSVEAKVRVK
jgi:membrane fusion protein (multidrug efflux system)